MEAEIAETLQKGFKFLILSLLGNMLSLEATKMSNYPTLEELLENQFFSNAPQYQR